MLTLRYPEPMEVFQEEWMLEHGVDNRTIMNILIKESIKKRYDPKYVLTEDIIFIIFKHLNRPVFSNDDDKALFFTCLVDAIRLTIEYFLTHFEKLERFQDDPKVDRIIAGTMVIK